MIGVLELVLFGLEGDFLLLSSKAKATNLRGGLLHEKFFSLYPRMV